MKNLLLLTIFFTLTLNAETVYVESPTDTDSDGIPDRIYVSISRPNVDVKIPTIMEMSPYSMGSNSVNFHNVDSTYLPQEELNKMLQGDFSDQRKQKFAAPEVLLPDNKFVYASVSAHSLGTGRSTGCPTIGDESEILAAKAVIEWLNGKGRAWDAQGAEVSASWSNGKVGMKGVSYNGTLPIMVASSGVKGLKAIVPIAAISNWYDYYRANGLVVGPGGYIGEDADVLGYFVVRSGHCKSEMERLTQTMGRENGDYTPFWVARNHLLNVKNIKAATFIVHGQSDWNVRQKHAIQLWEGLEGVVPRRMILHRGGHGVGSAFDVNQKIQKWFAHFLADEENGITDGPLVEVENVDGSNSIQQAWPHEKSVREKYYLADQNQLSKDSTASGILEFVDQGKTKKIEDLMSSPTEMKKERLMFLSEPLTAARLFSGTGKVSLRLAVKNRKAANVTVVLVQITKNGKKRIITRGWADPQNSKSIAQGKKLEPGQFYDLAFDLEPKQMMLEEGSQIGVLVASTDYDFTLRPDAGTEIQIELGESSFIEMGLTR
jgi:X-Pro dipeptidyl-peptidase